MTSAWVWLAVAFVAWFAGWGVTGVVVRWRAPRRRPAESRSCEGRRHV